MIVCLSVFLVVLGLWSLFGARSLLQWSYVTQRWQYRDAPEMLEPSDASLFLTRSAGVASLLLVACMGVWTWDTARADDGCGAVVSAWGGTMPPGEDDTCDAIVVHSVLDASAGVDSGPAPRGYVAVADGLPRFLDEADLTYQEVRDAELLVGPVAGACDIGLKETADAVQVWLPQECDDEPLDVDGVVDDGVVALTLVAVELDAPLGDRTVVGPDGRAVARITADVPSRTGWLGWG
ncbi:MAG: hypothetical protein ACRDT4_07760 [Micromonosporaceae bacterium]